MSILEQERLEKIWSNHLTLQIFKKLLRLPKILTTAFFKNKLLNVMFGVIVL